MLTYIIPHKTLNTRSDQKLWDRLVPIPKMTSPKYPITKILCLPNLSERNPHMNELRIMPLVRVHL